MIPKIIHYCWFGKKPLPPLALKCIASWKKYLPDYEIKEWNENNFDVNIIPYTKEAYEASKYAFVSDYARFWILYKYGGLYFDTDVEIIRPMDTIIAKGAFMGCEGESNKGVTKLQVNPGLGLGCNPRLDLYKEILQLYTSLHFRNVDKSLNLTTVVQYTTEILIKHGLCDNNSIQQIANIWIYPKEYFCPISVIDGKLKITNNTYTIHHYAQSWQSPIRKYGRKLALLIGGKRLKNILKKTFIREK